jgi:hypothetical protein
VLTGFQLIQQDILKVLADIKMKWNLAVQSLSEVGKKNVLSKLYSEASGIFEFGANTRSTTFLDDNVYYGLIFIIQTSIKNKRKVSWMLLHYKMLMLH